MLPDSFSCSLLNFPIFAAPCSLFQSFVLPAHIITFSLLPTPFLILGHAPCYLNTPNRGSSVSNRDYLLMRTVGIKNLTFLTGRKVKDNCLQMLH